MTAVEPQESKRFWFEEKVDIYQVEQTLYKIPQYMLRTHSEPLSILFGAPTGEGALLKPNSKTNPFVLHGITCEAFEDFLSVQTQAIWDHPTSFPIKMGENILDLAKRFELEASYRWALHQLNRSRWQQDSLEPIELLALALRHNVRPWVEIAVPRVLALGAAALRSKTQEMLQKGFPPGVISILKDQASEIADIYQSVACCGPSIPIPPEYSPPHDHIKCQALWRRFWLHVVAPKLRHRTNPIKLSDLGEFLDKQPIPAMPIACRDLAVSVVRHHRVLYHENNAIGRAVKEISGYIFQHHYSEIDESIIRF